MARVTNSRQRGNSEFEKDAHIHNVEVHEGFHVVQDGYDFTVVDEDGNDTGVFKPHTQRQSEIEAFEVGDRSEEELRNK